jgi:hypothetical protein
MKRSSFVSLLFAAAMLAAAPAGHAALLHFKAFLDGPTEAPPNASPGTGFAIVDIDTDAHTMHVQAGFSDLLSPTTVAHIHCCTLPTAGVATTTPTFPGFPAGVTSGTYENTFDLEEASSYRAGFITDNGDGTVAGAEAALMAGLLAGNAYFNIHTTQFPAGEIRGFLQIPEPGMIGLLGLGLAAAFAATRRRRG